MSRWSEQIAPVLEALAATDNATVRDAGLYLGPGNNGQQALGVDVDDRGIHEAMLLMADANYVQFTEQLEGGGSAFLQDPRVTGEGQQALGEWPRFELLMTPSTLAVLLEKMAEQADSEEKRTILKRAAAYVRTLPATAVRSAGVAIGIHLLRGAGGLP